MVSNPAPRAAGADANTVARRPARPASPARLRSSATAIWSLAPVVAASGFAGLGYEIVWTRLLSLTLGTEMMAVLGVVAGFFCGLALGAFALDRPIRQARSPRAAYAVLEVVIGLWAVASVWLLPWAGRALLPLLGPEPAPIVLWAASFVLPALTLLPATVAMGGTLTALERMLASVPGHARVAAGVYGANTAGAVAGTLVATFCLLPALGLSATLIVLAALNALCAVGALAFGPVAGGMSPTPHEARSSSAGQGRLAVTLFMTGLLGVAFEMIVVRLAAQVMQDTIYTFAGLLAAYLLGTAAGGLIWQRIGRRGGETALGWLIAATSLVCLATAAITPFAARVAEANAAMGIAGELLIAAALFLLPSACMGAVFATLAQTVRDQRGSLGWAVGVNSVGAALAPLLTSQVLIAGFGAWTALLPVSLAYLLLLPIRRGAIAWCAAPLVAGIVLWVRPAPSLIRVPMGGALLAVREGPMATASVVDDASGARYLEVNGHFRMGGTNSVRSDYRQAMLPLLLHPAPQRALFLGVGTGATLVGGARMPGVSVHGVELSPEVVALLPWFAAPPAPKLTPPVTNADARRYVAADRSQYDVIIADLFHPALDGSGSLYTVEHFAAVRERLAAGGVFCQWLPLYQLDLPSLRAIMRGFLDIYPGGSAWLAHFSVRTPMLALIGSRDGARIDPQTLAVRLGDTATGAVVRQVGFDAPIDVLGQYLGGPRSLAAFAGNGPRNSDDFPYVALDSLRNVRALSAPPYTLLLTVTREMRPDPAELLGAPNRDELAGRLIAYWRARDGFIEEGTALRGDLRGRALVQAAAPGLLDAIRLSADFNPAYDPLISMAQSLIATDKDAAARLLREIDAAAPSRSEARKLLVQVSGG